MLRRRAIARGDVGRSSETVTIAIAVAERLLRAHEVLSSSVQRGTTSPKNR